MEDEKKVMENDLFVNDFTYKKVIPITDIKDGKVRNYEFILKEISGMDSDRISKGAMSISKSGEMEIDQTEANIKFLQACIVKAPFAVTEDNLRKLSKKVKDELINFARKINTIGDGDEKKLDGLSEDSK